jgi:hypothetical protein
MRWGGMLAGALMVLGGGVWLLQGLNVAFAPRSFMTGDRSWVVIGAITAAAGLALLAWSARRAAR